MSEFLIMFREVLEGVLVVGILYTFIVKTGKLHLKKSITNGIVASFIATAIFAVIFQITYGGFEGKQAALFEGTTMLIAAFLLSTMIIWMGRNKNVAASLEKEASDIIDQDKNVSLGLFALTFFAIFREGVEVVLFMYAILIQSDGLSIGGSILGSLVALMIGYSIFIQGKKVPLKKFFNVTSILLIFVCAGLVAYGVHEFEEAFYTKDEMKKMEIWNINDSGPVFGFNIDDNGSPKPLFSDKGAVGQLFKGFFGYNGNPTTTEILSWLFTLILVSFMWRKAGQPVKID
ncbi:FTR1 family protein [Candidatus Marinimicrobia bacterium]|jgi:high-affinity iron transporter|nr:FTR1 family protein [Candidatus Neomarinimicrobiota bacterium]MDA9841304.1 FTR1 family protein [Candidatus Neomarinimicrobiota bacterium]MDB3979825.1 FTR1 family protein [Candidatus Neomarinimicrobiota bacterium]MDC0521209.1 FTR1 family protein [Candidatus Neomarinimicrobiota bacterium]MDC0654098.1 FTR1 family protein [Candidatus Neomarinimicrobiota bacterium]|tara:strand:- start:1623 stop:2489 length:867 start_codon:yes stop_codon:yes gene_type:complete